MTDIFLGDITEKTRKLLNLDLYSSRNRYGTTILVRTVGCFTESMYLRDLVDA